MVRGCGGGPINPTGLSNLRIVMSFWSSTETTKLLRTLAIYADALKRIETEASNLNVRYTTAQQRHTAYGAKDSVEDVEPTFLAARAGYRSTATTLIDQCRRIILDKDLVVAKLALPLESGFSTVIAKLISEMGAIDYAVPVTINGLEEDLAYTNDNTTLSVSNPTTADAAGRTGLRLLTTLALDGVTAPTNDVVALPTNAGKITQTVKKSETFTVEVTADSELGGRPAGQELFQIFSTNRGQQYDGGVANSGTVNNVATAHQLGEAFTPSNALIPTFTVTDTPDGWTVDGGTAGTQFSEDDTNTFRGGSSIAIGSNVTFQLSKQIPSASIVRKGIYALYWWEYASAQGAPTPEFFDASVSSSQGFGDPIETKVYAATGAAATQAYSNGAAWRLRWKLYLAQDVQPLSSYTLRIASTGTNTACSISSVGIAQMQYYGGVGYLLIPGDTDPLVGTQWSTSLTKSDFDSNVNDYYIGEWARFFVKALGVQPICLEDWDEDNPPYDQILNEAAAGAEDLDAVPT